MTMPMIPGLMGGADFPGEAEDDTDATSSNEAGRERLLAALDNADPDDIESLAAEANEAYAAGELDAVLGETPPDAIVGEPDDDIADEMGEGAPTSAELDAASTSTIVASIVSEIAQLQNELNTLADAESGSEADVDVESALEVVTEALTEAEEAMAEAEAAVADENLDAANEAKAKAEGALEKAKEAKEGVITEAKDAAGELEEPSAPDPLLLWAQAQDG